MAWIRTIPDDEWDGALAPLDAAVRDRNSGRIDNIMSVHLLNPTALRAHHALYSSVMSGTSTLRKVERELIAFVVSQINECDY